MVIKFKKTSKSWIRNLQKNPKDDLLFNDVALTAANYLNIYHNVTLAIHCLCDTLWDQHNVDAMGILVELYTETR